MQIYCMDIKTPNDAATIELHIEPQFVGVPFSQLLVNPAYPQLKGETHPHQCLYTLYIHMMCKSSTRTIKTAAQAPQDKWAL